MSHAFIPFFSRLFVTHNGRCKTVLLSVGETSWKLLPYATHTHTYRGEKFKYFGASTLFFFFSSSRLTFNRLLESKHKSPETQQSYQESTSVLQMPIALERLFSPAPPLLTKTFLTSPLLFLFGCSKWLLLIELQPRLLSQCSHQLGHIRVYFLISPHWSGSQVEFFCQDNPYMVLTAAVLYRRKPV